MVQNILQDHLYYFSQLFGNGYEFIGNVESESDFQERQLYDDEHSCPAKPRKSVTGRTFTAFAGVIEKLAINQKRIALDGFHVAMTEKCVRLKEG